MRRKIIGDAKPITHRPADDLKPEMDKYRQECKQWAESDEDVLSYALFPQVAEKFFAVRDKKTPPNIDENGVRQLVVEDLSV